ncbi:MAG: 3-hydroxybutyryl-CoA dehydrogenase [Leptospiraceae bacterium]|nr:3-hydroxybutyryl-CoA dehydrogenase [Leptospiraceae bacterium]
MASQGTQTSAENGPLQKILIAGGGAMGAGIGYIFARAYPNAQVDVMDTNEKVRIAAADHFEKWAAKDKERDEKAGKIPVDITGRLNILGGFGKAQLHYDLMIEAITENLELKKKIFSEFDLRAHDHSLFASNTSSLSITTLSTAVNPKRQGRVIGLHFFNPPRIMKLLEIVTTEATEPSAISLARDVAANLDKTPVICKDAPGFITSRLGIVLINEAIFALQEGLMSAEDIDTSMKLGYNFPMGPLALADFIGLDVVFAVTQTLYDSYQDSKYRPCMLLRKKVEAGHLGQKSGRGFFIYDK